MITLDKAIQYLNLDESNISDVSLVEDYINETTLLIEFECQTNILTNEVEIIFNGDNYKYYCLNCFKVNSITSIKYRQTAFDDWITLDSDDYILTYINNMYRIVFKDDLKLNYEYQIITNQGVSLEDVPTDIQKVAKEMVYIAYKNQNKDLLGKSNISESNLGTSIGTTYFNLTPTWRSILKKYTYRSLMVK